MSPSDYHTSNYLKWRWNCISLGETWCYFDDQMYWEQRFLLAMLCVVWGSFRQLGAGPVGGGWAGWPIQLDPLVRKRGRQTLSSHWAELQNALAACAMASGSLGMGGSLCVGQEICSVTAYLSRGSIGQGFTFWNKSLYFTVIIFVIIFWQMNVSLRWSLCNQSTIAI